MRKFSVYVVELAPAASRNGKPAVYVGETGLTPAERFARHQAGGMTSSPTVARHGVALRPDLSVGVGPFDTRQEAEAAELALAERLRARGFDVHGGQGRTFSMRA